MPPAAGLFTASIRPPPRSSRTWPKGTPPNIVFADADLEAAAKMALLGIFYNKGEVCTAGSRLFVEKSIYDGFMEKVTARAQQLQPADPMDPKARLGPLVNDAQLSRVKKYVELGKKEGARLLVGGSERANKPGMEAFEFYTQTKSAWVDLSSDSMDESKRRENERKFPR